MGILTYDENDSRKHTLEFSECLVLHEDIDDLREIVYNKNSKEVSFKYKFHYWECKLRRNYAFVLIEKDLKIGECELFLEVSSFQAFILY